MKKICIATSRLRDGINKPAERVKGGRIPHFVARKTLSLSDVAGLVSGNPYKKITLETNARIMLEAVIQAIEAGDRIRIEGFGVLTPSIARNVVDGKETFTVRSILLVPDKEMKHRLSGIKVETD